jgi:hypothetical protein
MQPQPFTLSDMKLSRFGAGKPMPATIPCSKPAPQARC